MLPHFALLLLLVVPHSLAVTTKFEFSGKIWCQRPHVARGPGAPPWVFWIELWESDAIWGPSVSRVSDDHLEQNYTLDLTKEQARFTIDAVAHGDSDILVTEYELYYRIKHNCNRHRTPEIKDVEISNRYWYDRFDDKMKTYWRTTDSIDVTNWYGKKREVKEDLN